MSPTARSLDRLRKMGYTAEVVEKYNAFTKQRKDLFGCIDIVGITEQTAGVLGIQATTTSHMGARIQKSMAEPRLTVWLKNGNRFIVWGWSKKGPRGKRKLWELSEKEMTLDNNYNIRYT